MNILESSQEDDYANNMTSKFYNWPNDTYIKKFFAPFERPDDIHKLLTENKIFMKELGKAHTQNAKYNIDYFKIIFNDIFVTTKLQASCQSSLTQEIKNNLIIYYMWRTVMDMYTITRILCKKLKNFIFMEEQIILNELCIFLQNILVFKY